MRMAQSLRDQLSNVARRRTMALAQQLGWLTGAMGQFESLRRKLNLALVRGWDAAAMRLGLQVPQTLQNIPYYMQAVQREANACEIGVPTLRGMLDDLLQLEAEFGEVDCRPECEGVAVTTDPIDLDDVYLGSFEIRLNPEQLGCDQGHAAFRIIAQDPHPAASNSSITHPHVSDERLCAGDAVVPIRSALAAGRICDAFMLIRSVLTTYNSGSPYVSLGEWYGRPCHDCGYLCGPDDSNTCEACENEICDGCASYCRVCSDTHCVGCLETCSVCDDRVCSSCMTKCPDCGESLCKNCLEDGKCPCHENDEEDDQNDKNEESENEPQDQQPTGANQGVAASGTPASPNIEAA